MPAQAIHQSTESIREGGFEKPRRHTYYIFKSIAWVDLVSVAYCPPIRPPSSSLRRSQEGYPHVSEHRPFPQEPAKLQRQIMQRQSSLRISWGNMPLRAGSPTHSGWVPRDWDLAAHSPAASLPCLSPRPGHTSLLSAVDAEGAPRAGRKRGDLRVWPWGRPQGLPGGRVTAEQSPVGGHAWIPSSAAFRVDFALRALNP